MFCPNCGTQLPEQTKFCSKCGSPIASSSVPQQADSAAAEPVGGMPPIESQPAPTGSAAGSGATMAPMMAPASGSSAPAGAASASGAPNFGTPVSVPAVQPTQGGGGFTPPPTNAAGAVPPAQPGKKKGPAPIIIIAVVAVVVVLAIVGLLLRGCLGGKGPSGKAADLYAPPAKVSMFTDEDGAAAAVFSNGSYAVVPSDVYEGYASADGSVIAYEDDDDGLYVAKGDGTGVEKVFDNVDDIRSVSATSVVYEDWSDYTLYAYMISSGDTLNLGEYDSSIGEYKFALGTSSVAFVDEDGKMVVWADGADSAETVVSVGDSVEILAVSDSGNIAIWSEIGDGDETLMAYEDGEVVNLGRFDTGASGSYGYFYAFINADESAYVIDAFYHDEVVYKEVGSDPLIVDAGADLYSVTLSSEEGPFPRIYGGIDGAFILTDDQLGYYEFDSGDSVYICNPTSYSVRSGTLAYIEGGDLYVTTANGTRTLAGDLVGTDVQDMQVSDNGRYVYWVTDDEELYMWKYGDNEPTLVSSNPAYEEGILTSSFVIAEGGETVYYVEGSSSRTLYSYTYGDREGTEIKNNLASAYLLEGTEYIGDNDSFSFLADGDTVYVLNDGDVESVLSGVEEFM